MSLFLILTAVVLSSITFIALSFLAIVCGVWLKVGQDFNEQSLAQAEFGFKKIALSLVFAYFLEFLLPLSVFILFSCLLPIGNVRFGIIFALLVFAFNASQMFLLSLQKIPIPLDFAVFTLFWKLLKYLIGFGIVGFILSF